MESRINKKYEIAKELLELGFEQNNVQIALYLTNNKEEAAEIALKLTEEGPNANLSMYILSHPKLSYHTGKPKMLFVVNGYLKMGKGKICAQVGHAVIGAYMQIEYYAKFDSRAKERLEHWDKTGAMKVVVRVDKLSELLTIKKKLYNLNIGINLYLVEDAGHTQIEAGSKTVLGIGPAFPEYIDQITQGLRLL